MENIPNYRSEPWPEGDNEWFYEEGLDLGYEVYITGRFGQDILFDHRKGNRRLEHCPLMLACEKGELGQVRKLLAAGECVNEVDAFSNTPLIYACRGGRLAIVSLLLANGADVNHQGYYKTTPIIMAASVGSVPIVKLLLSKGAKIGDENKSGLNALHKAAIIGNLDLVRLCISKGLHVNIKDSCKFTPMVYACKRGHLDVVKYLISKRAWFDRRKFKVESCLCMAAKYGHQDIVELLLSYELNVDEVDMEEDATPLYFACRWGTLSTAQYLISKGADVNYVDKRGDTALLGASDSGNLAKVQLLISEGANIHHVNNSNSNAVHCAIHVYSLNSFREKSSRNDDCVNHVAVVEFLLQKGADVNNVSHMYSRGNSVILTASQVNDADLMRILLSYGANIHDRNEYGETPLMMAAAGGNDSVVEVLLSNGANVSDKNFQGETALVKATEKKKISTMKLLVAAGADIKDSKKKWGPSQTSSLLRIAMETRSVEVVNYVLSCGFDINGEDLWGKPVFENACCSYGFDDIVKTLFLHGADIGDRQEVKIEKNPGDKKRKRLNLPLLMLLYCLGELQVQLTLDQIELMGEMVIGLNRPQ